MKVLILCHKTRGDAVVLETILKARGFELDVRLAYHDEMAEINPAEHDLTIFMGGMMGVYQDDIFPYLKNELLYLEKRLSLGKPYLGVCLGAQLMAKALGADVYPGEAGVEIGWHSLQVNEKGMKTPLRHLDETRTAMMQFHGDTFDKPADATLLASSKMYKNQAISYGDKALGVQFHPEFTQSHVEFILAIAYRQLQQGGLTAPVLRAQTIEHIDLLDKQRALFFNEWLDQVVGTDNA